MPAAPDGESPVRSLSTDAGIRLGEVGAAAGTPGSPFDVVALVASAGGLSALNQVLLPLPDSFNAAVIIVQHLGQPG